MKNKNLIAEYSADYKGQKVIVRKFKAKDRKVKQNVRRNAVNCPNCLSSIKVSDSGVSECSADRIKMWEKEFHKFYHSTNEQKSKFLSTLTSDNRFLDLYEKWVYAYENNKPEEFNCGYTNKIFLPISAMKTNMPDPVYLKQVEDKLGRKLTLEEILGEEELWIYNGTVSKRYRRGAKKVRVPIISLPEDV